MQLDYDPSEPSTHSNPYPIFARLRAEKPVFWSSHLKGWVVTRHADARWVLSDADNFSSARIQPFLDSIDPGRREDIGYLGDRLSKWAVFADQPYHTKLRPVMNRGFVPAILKMEPRIRLLIDELLGKLADRRSFDVMADFAVPLPTLVITLMLGLPREDAPQLKEWSDDLAAFVAGSKRAPDKNNRSSQAMAEMEAYFAKALHRARARPNGDGDVISRLIAASQESDDPLTDDELIQTFTLLAFAGHETTTDLIGNGMFHLMNNPDQMAYLVANPEAMEFAVEEFLRIDNPALAIVRVARTEISVGDVKIQEGERIFVLINAANHDPEKYTDPERLDVKRRPKGIVSFGVGIHVCVGAPLARMEGRLALAALLRRFPDLDFSTPVLQWRDAYVVRGIVSLPVHRRAPAAA